MNAMVVWVMIIVSGPGNVWNTGPEFTSREKCEVAAKVIHKAVEDTRWGIANVRKPICIKIEK